MLYLGKKTIVPNNIIKSDEINNQDKTITQNGIYSADPGYTGLGTVNVNVDGGTFVSAKNITGLTITSGDRIWLEPYNENNQDLVLYNIIPHKMITNDSIVGIAQQQIQNNTSGLVKAVLSGNGNYAPSRATKIANANGVYTAYGDNVYGFSSFAVDIRPTTAEITDLLTEINSRSGIVNVNE